jgi:hypothetical protein
MISPYPAVAEAAEAPTKERKAAASAKTGARDGSDPAMWINPRGSLRAIGVANQDIEHRTLDPLALGLIEDQLLHGNLSQKLTLGSEAHP